jgi:hypothetical protein
MVISETEGKGGVWLHRCVSSALCTEYKKESKRHNTWRSFISSSKELSVSGYVRASAETEAGKGEYGCISVSYGLNIKRGRKHGEALFVLQKELSVSGYVRATAGSEAEKKEYGCIGVYLRPYVLNIKREPEA